MWRFFDPLSIVDQPDGGRSRRTRGGTKQDDEEEQVGTLLD
jgi:hypothetical protein